MNSLKPLAAIDKLKYVFRLFSVRFPPMDSSANGSVTMENNANVLSMNLGNTRIVFEKINPATQAINSGLENTALKVTCTCFQKVSRRPENQIKTETAIKLTQGMTIPIKIPKCRPPISPNALSTNAIPT